MPFSQGEIDGIREDFLDSLFVDPEQLRGEGRSRTGRQEYAERACRGGLPLAVAVSGAARQRWYRSYVSTSLERDVRELSQIRRAAALPRLLERLAGQTGQVLNISRASAAADLDARTADNYVRLLEGLFLIRRLPAWGRTLRARAAAVPKLHLVDSGLAAHLLRITPERLARPDPAAAAEFGHLLETFVVGELLKQASWHDEVAGVGHWRTHDGQEVDLVLERYDGSIVAFEVKSSSRIRPGDISGLRVLRDTLGEQFHAGVVLGTMEHAVGLEDRIYAAPIDRLWRPRP